VTFRVNFPFNNATDPYEFTLDDRGMPSDLRWRDMIDRTADFLRRFNGAPGRHFDIIGHTDPVGSDPFNLDLGRRRAEFIRTQLVKRGVSAALLSVSSEGESNPLPMRDNETEELYHARLRRVEMVRR
jgi:outer membrane protein OmpA-like peptidoglycan-associated protein